MLETKKEVFILNLRLQKENLSLKVKKMVLNRATLYKCSLNEETLLKSESEISSFINDGI